MADVFRDNAFPRLIDRIIFRIEATLYLLAGVLLLFFITSEAADTDKVRSPLSVVIDVIASQPAIWGLGVVAMIIGSVAWWATLDQKREKILEHMVFGFFLVRLYAFLGTILISNGLEDTRWMNHFSWVLLWAAYWLVFRLRQRHE